MTVTKVINASSDALLGFAQFPGGPLNSDAAVHAYFTIGSIVNPNPAGGTYGMGRTDYPRSWTVVKP